MASFILEIGTEELPARFQKAMREALFLNMQRMLTEANVGYRSIRVDVTPRRAVLFVEDLDSHQKTQEELIIGPPIKIAFGSENNPTQAAHGFARTHGVEIEKTFIHDTGKGEYLAVKKQAGGKAVAELLTDICPLLIRSIPFPKRMHWKDKDFTFARPIRWIVALLDSNIISFTLAGVSSSNVSRGHRVHGQQEIPIPHAKDYYTIMERTSGVNLSSEKRQSEIKEKGNTLGASIKGSVIWKEDLLEEVTGLVEHPYPVLGNIDEKFLALPREVILTSMEKHQKSFGIEDKDGNLLPYFLTVLNISPKDLDLVRAGWERVLKARLEDARFFWETDLQHEPAQYLADLDRVVFLAGLGSLGDKTKRLAALCEWIAKELGIALPEDARRAGRLSKFDLVTGMVGEFDTLQGIMGGIYGYRKGEKQEVANALAEQYLPAGPESPLPNTPLGAILSLADKADTLVGCFGMGITPTGTADPFGLRRCAIGIIRIMIKFNIGVDVEALFSSAQKFYANVKWKIPPHVALSHLMEFFCLRLKNYLVVQGLDTLVAEAVCAKGCGNPARVQKKGNALKAFSHRPDYLQIIQTFKRVINIIRKQEGFAEGWEKKGIYDPALFTEQAEKDMAAMLEESIPIADALRREQNFEALLAQFGSLRSYMETFFENVMVMCEDKTIRINRLNLLQAFANYISQDIDFMALQV